MSQKLKIILIISLFMVAVVFFLIIPEVVLARAGGGGGGTSLGVLTILLLPFLMIYSVILSRYIAQKNRQCKKVIHEISRYDYGWFFSEIKDRIETIYYKVQEAWMARDQEIARDYVSTRLFNIHKIQTDRMINLGTKNVLHRINLDKTLLVEAADYNDNSKDRIWAVIKGSMVDYIVDEKTDRVVSGEKDKVDSFQELWKFIRDPKKGWVLDEINSDVELSDIENLNSFSENLGHTPPAKEMQESKINYLHLSLLIGFGLILPWILAIYSIWPFIEPILLKLIIEPT